MPGGGKRAAADLVPLLPVAYPLSKAVIRANWRKTLEAMRPKDHKPKA
jgi:hypothetical protein